MKARVAVSLTVLLAVWVVSASPADVDVVSRDHPVEQHHSLHAPMDANQIYWKIGGSTVLSTNKIRLTPSTQDRRGWLWNEYPLESANWEVEFSVEVQSKPHYGGEGVAFWVISPEQDPAFSEDPEIMSGPLFGMRESFQGFGVIVDVYDNDNRRNNPTVFVLENLAGDSKQYNNDNDFENDMYKKTPKLKLGRLFGRSTTPAHKCVADFRNLARPVNMLVRYLHKELHVYINSNDNSGWKFCLAVAFEQTFEDYHLVFSAATGQVADVHDVNFISTRYLKESDRDMDDSLLEQLNAGSRTSWGALARLAMAVLGGAVAGVAWHIYRKYSEMNEEGIDDAIIKEAVNPLFPMYYSGHGAVCLLLLLTHSYWIFLFNAPLLLFNLAALFYGVHNMNHVGRSVGYGAGARQATTRKAPQFMRKLSFGQRLQIAMFHCFLGAFFYVLALLIY